jgi:hypothetical protein
MKLFYLCDPQAQRFLKKGWELGSRPVELALDNGSDGSPGGSEQAETKTIY